MAEQSTERVTVEIGKKLISLIVPDLDPELAQLILRRMAYSTEYGRAGHEGQREGLGEDQAGVLQEQVRLLALIRDADIDQAHLRAFLKADGS
jgi:hypothetical protein